MSEDIDTTNQKSTVQLAFSGVMKAYREQGSLSKKDRKKYLKALKKILIKRQEDFVSAISEDFGGRSSMETKFAEILMLVFSIRHTLQNLDEWMENQSSDTHWAFWPARLQVRPQAKGVVGVISPWNYPLKLALTPLAQAISAGNRVLLKPSELAPKTSSLVEEIITEIFPADVVRVVTGGAEVATEFSKLPFHHLFFTGSYQTGKKIMAAASQNLTPVTLELGGKSPALIHPSYSISKAASRIATGKLLNAGQTCLAPDYVLCPKDRVGDFVNAITKTIKKTHSKIENNEDYTAIFGPKHLQRLQSLLTDAEGKGAKIHVINPSQEELMKKMAPTLLTEVSDEMTVMQEEIFGPILPIVPYTNLDEAIAFINDRPRALAVYYFDNRSKRVRQVLNQTVSGGVCINDTILQISQESVPFGGIGQSGMGRYHGKAGFDTFSHLKTVYYQSRFSVIPFVLKTPYTKLIRTLVRFLMWR